MKVLILGVGPAQVDAIEYCKAKRHEVYGCSYTNTEKGISLLDHFEQINIIDVDKVRQYVSDNGIEIVYSVGSDIAMPTACKVSEQLDLPHFVRYDTAYICNNKHIMRETLGSSFEGNVPYVVCSKWQDALDYSEYPGIIKPVDSQGQRGVFKVDSTADALEHFNNALSYSKDGKVIIEKYLEGREVSVNAYMSNGTMVYGLVSDRISFEEFPGGIIKEHYIPSGFSDSEQQRILDLAKRVAAKLEIDNGPCYFQIKVVDGRPFIIEVTPRLDGCHMWKLIRHYDGVDLLDVTLTNLIEGSISDNDLNPHVIHDGVRTVFMCQPPETELKEKQDYSSALEVRWYYEIGEKIRRMNGYMEKCGYRMEAYRR